MNVFETWYTQYQRLLCELVDAFMACYAEKEAFDSVRTYMTTNDYKNSIYYTDPNERTGVIVGL